MFKELNNTDYQSIYEHALREFLDKNQFNNTEHLNLARCYTKAIIVHLSSIGYEIVKKEKE